MDFNELNSFLQRTGFKAATSESSIDYGKWFRIDSIDSLPPFITSHSNVGEGKPWRPPRKDTPDLWIDPRNSAVVTLNAGEIVFSSVFPVGVTLRFPRITRLRLDKDPDEIETDTSLWDLFNKVEAERAQGSNSFAPLAGSAGQQAKFRRFLTESQYSKQKKNINKRPQNKANLSVSIASAPQKLKSKAFEGLSFCVLKSGKFTFESEGMELDQRETRDQDWIEAASCVKSKTDVETFIKEHGGKVTVSPHEESFVLGGKKNDISVQLHVQGIEHARGQAKPTAKKPTKKALKYQKMAERKGVLRWTFPFSLFSKWKALSLEGTIKTAAPQLMTLNTLDYLAQPSSQNKTSKLRSLGKLDNVVMMQRALELAEEITPSVECGTLDWYKVVWRNVDPKHAWVLECGPQVKQDSTSQENTNSPSAKAPDSVTIEAIFGKQQRYCYPDVFPIACRQPPEIETDRWDQVLPGSEEILSVLPLLRVRGVNIVSNLYDRVTHVVCQLPPGTTPINLSKHNDEGKNMESLCHSTGARDIASRLSLDAQPRDIWLISPSWIRGVFHDRLGG